MKKRFFAALSAAVVVLTGLVPATAPAAPGSLLSAVALGDSFGSGTGAGNYEAGTIGGCYRSRNSYSELTVARLGLLGCRLTLQM